MKAVNVSLCKSPILRRLKDIEKQVKLMCEKIIKKLMVGVAGFEPTTSPTPRVCASQAALYSDLKFGIVAKLYLILAFYMESQINFTSLH